MFDHRNLKTGSKWINKCSFPSRDLMERNKGTQLPHPWLNLIKSYFGATAPVMCSIFSAIELQTTSYRKKTGNSSLLDFVSRYCDPKIIVGGNCWYLFNFSPNICKSWCLNSHFIPITMIWSTNKWIKNYYSHSVRTWSALKLTGIVTLAMRSSTVFSKSEQQIKMFFVS